MNLNRDRIVGCTAQKRDDDDQDDRRTIYFELQPLERDQGLFGHVSQYLESTYVLCGMELSPSDSKALDILVVKVVSLRSQRIRILCSI